jgi:beta-lactamase regulating signal transducer with metallopeptidase domain
MHGAAAVSFETLANFGFKGVMVLSFACLIGSLIRHKSAAAQHAFWFIALAAAGAAPLLYLVSPKVDFISLPGMVFRNLAGLLGSGSEPSSAQLGSPLGGAFPAGAVPLFIYMIGLGLFCTYLVLGRLYAYHIRCTATPFKVGRARAEMVDLAHGMGLTSEIILLESGRISTPIATGLIHPVVIMPTDAASWPETVVRSALAHELAHIRRRDLLSRAVGYACCAINWFNPLAWFALRRMMREQEFACDLRASQCFERPAAYAEGLLTAATARRGALAGAATGMGMSGGMIERLSEVLRPRREKRLTRLKSLVTALFLTAVLVYPIAVLNLVAKRAGVTEEAAAERAAIRAGAEKAWRDYYRSKGIEPDRIRILKKTEDSIYFSYTLRR